MMHHEPNLLAALVFLLCLAVLGLGSLVGDYWVQTSHQAAHKGDSGWSGRMACAAHATTLTGTQALLLGPLLLVFSLPVPAWAFLLGLAFNAWTHYVIDRRAPLAAVARLVGRGEFHGVGAGAGCMGTGSRLLDQSAHALMCLGASLIMTLPLV